MADKTCSIADIVGQIQDGMTVGIGGWGSRRKPMALVRALARSDVEDLTLVSYGGPDVGILCATGKVKKVVFGFVSLDSIPLEPYFRRARQAAEIEVMELDEGMFQWGLYAAALRLPFLPTRAGLGSDILTRQPELKTLRSPYADQEELVAVPALSLDVALVHVNRADPSGNAMILGPDPYFDDLFCMAAERAFMSAERVIPTEELLDHGPPQALVINRMMTDGVVACPGGAHFTECLPDYPRDELFQRWYASGAKDPAAWDRFAADFLAAPTGDVYAAALAALRRELGE